MVVTLRPGLVDNTGLLQQVGADVSSYYLTLAECYTRHYTLKERYAYSFELIKFGSSD